MESLKKTPHLLPGFELASPESIQSCNCLRSPLSTRGLPICNGLALCDDHMPWEALVELCRNLWIRSTIESLRVGSHIGVEDL